MMGGIGDIAAAALAAEAAAAAGAGGGAAMAAMAPAAAGAGAGLGAGSGALGSGLTMGGGGLGLTGSLAPATSAAAPFALSGPAGMASMGGAQGLIPSAAAMGSFGALPAASAGMSGLDMLKYGNMARNMMGEDQKKRGTEAQPMITMPAMQPRAVLPFSQISPYARNVQRKVY